MEPAVAVRGRRAGGHVRPGLSTDSRFEKFTGAKDLINVSQACQDDPGSTAVTQRKVI